MTNSRKKSFNVGMRVLRIALITVILAVLFGSYAVHAGSETITYDKNEYVYKVISVQPGDSLWSLGEDWAGSTDDDIREWISNVEEMNGMKSDVLKSGQNLLIYCGQSMADVTR